MLEDDDFRVVGHITLELPSNFRVHFALDEAKSWAPAIYAFRIGGIVARIGKSEKELEERINQWNKDVPRALAGKFHKGGTNPWEAFQWRTGLTKHGQGEFRAQPVKENLLSRERDLINRYDPPLCNDSPCARHRPPWARSVKDVARAKAFWKLLLGPFF